MLHPAFGTCPGHANWTRDFSGAAGLFGVIFHPCSDEHIRAFVDALHHFGIGVSWGGYESLAIPFDPAQVHVLRPWPPGIDTGSGLGVRLSIGLEDPGDLIADLDQALNAAS